MKEIQGYDAVQASEESSWAKPTAGGYVCMILDAEDVPFDQLRQKGDYLKLNYDFAEGELCSYFTDLNNRFGNWPASGTFRKSYKEKAMPFFKAFLTAVEQSNPGYKWNWDEKSLKGKYIGIVLGEEEYEYQGQIKTRVYVDSCRSVKAIRENDFKIPEPKRIAPAASDLKEDTTRFSSSFVPANTDDLPF